MGKAKKYLGLGLVCASFFFLFNPSISVIDLLPDCIGYLLLCLGVSQLADLNYHFEEAKKNFRKMLIVSVLQLGALLLLFGMVTGRDRPTALLLVSFLVATAELVFLTKAYNEFFEGFLYLGSRMECTSVFRVSPREQKRYETRCEKEERRLAEENLRRERMGLPPREPRTVDAPKNATAKASRATVVFIFLKLTLNILPELTALTQSMYDETNRLHMLYDYINLFRTFAVFLGIPVGIVWLVKIFRYVLSIIKDKPFMEALKQKYIQEVEPKTYLFIQRGIRLAFAILAIGVFLCADIYMESGTINVLPDTLCALLILGALLLLRRFVKIPFYSYAFCGIYAAFSAFTLLTSYEFFEKYTLHLTLIRPEAYEAFEQLKVVEIVDSAFFALMMLSLLPVLSRLIKQYTGFSPVTQSNVQAEDKIRYVHDMLHKRLITMAVLIGLCLISGICYILFVSSANFMWIVDFIVCSILAIYTMTTLSAITQEVEYKYLLD